MDLHVTWYLLLGVLLVGYAILDGFDLGVGIMHPLARTDHERRLFVNAIGPLWDGNEVWLVTFGGALFAMFPEAYATIFSGFYLALMLLLCALIFRAVSLEFRSKVSSESWRRGWDWAFFGSSLLATLLFGVAIGNAMWGIPLDERGLFVGSFFGLLGPYQLLVGLLAVSMFAMHGTIFLFLKTGGAVQERLGRWAWHTWGAFLALYMLTTVFTLVSVPRATTKFDRYPWGIILVLISILAIANIPRTLFNRRYGQAFLSSATVIATLLGLFGLAIFPNIVPASTGAEFHMTLENASSSDTTLKIGLLIVAIGFPFVLAYTSVIYWTFRGKVQLSEDSY